MKKSRFRFHFHFFFSFNFIRMTWIKQIKADYPQNKSAVLCPLNDLLNKMAEFFDVQQSKYLQIQYNRRVLKRKKGWTFREWRKKTGYIEKLLIYKFETCSHAAHGGLTAWVHTCGPSKPFSVTEKFKGADQ